MKIILHFFLSLLSLNTGAQIFYSDRNGYFDPVVTDFTSRNIGLDYSIKIKYSDDHFTVKWLNDTTVISVMENLAIDSEEIGDYVLHLSKGIFHDTCCIPRDSIVRNDTIIYKDRHYGGRKTKSFEVYDAKGRISYGKYVYLYQGWKSTFVDQYGYGSDTETVTNTWFYNDSIYSTSETVKIFSKGLLTGYTNHTTDFSSKKKIEYSHLFKLVYGPKARLRKIIMYSGTGKKQEVVKIKYTKSPRLGNKP